MPSLPVVLDPALLSFGQDSSQDELVTRVRFLIRWANLAQSGDVLIQIATAVRDSLIRGGYYPAHDSVAAVIDALNLRHLYAPQDLIVPINTILNRAAISLYCCVKDVDHEMFNSAPAQPWHRDPVLNDLSQRAAVLSAIETRLHEAPRQLLFASILNASAVEFSALVNLIDPDDLRDFEPTNLPKQVEGSMVLVGDIEAVFDCFSAEELWNTANDIIGIKSAIKFRCREKLKEMGTYTSMVGIPEFFVGSDFYRSLVAHQADGTARFASVTLENCASAVLRLPTLEWNPFHKNLRAKDLAEPLRAQLTKGSMAIRLMAWKRPGSTGALEFANIGPKWEEEISHTDPSDAV